MLFTSDFVGDPVVAAKGATDTMHTFEDLAAGCVTVRCNLLYLILTDGI